MPEKNRNLYPLEVIQVARGRQNSHFSGHQELTRLQIRHWTVCWEKLKLLILPTFFYLWFFTTSSQKSMKSFSELKFPSALDVKLHCYSLVSFVITYSDLWKAVVDKFWTFSMFFILFCCLFQFWNFTVIWRNDHHFWPKFILGEIGVNRGTDNRVTVKFAPLSTM